MEAWHLPTLQLVFPTSSSSRINYIGIFILTTTKDNYWSFQIAKCLFQKCAASESTWMNSDLPFLITLQKWFYLNKDGRTGNQQLLYTVSNAVTFVFSNFPHVLLVVLKTAHFRSNKLYCYDLANSSANVLLFT